MRHPALESETNNKTTWATRDAPRRYAKSRVCRHVAHRDESLGHAETLGAKVRLSDGLKRQRGGVPKCKLRARQDGAPETLGIVAEMPSRGAPLPRRRRASSC